MAAGTLGMIPAEISTPERCNAAAMMHDAGYQATVGCLLGHGHDGPHCISAVAELCDARAEIKRRSDHDAALLEALRDLVVAIDDAALYKISGPVGMAMRGAREQLKEA